MRAEMIHREMERERKVSATTKERKKSRSIGLKEREKKKSFPIQISTALFSVSPLLKSERGEGERTEDALAFRARRRLERSRLYKKKS